MLRGDRLAFDCAKLTTLVTFTQFIDGSTRGATTCITVYVLVFRDLEHPTTKQQSFGLRV